MVRTPKAAVGLTLLFLVGAVGAVRAQVLGQYSIFGLTGTPASITASSVAANVAMTDLVRGVGLAAGVSNNDFNSSGYVASYDPNKYIGFTVAPTGGALLSLASLSYKDFIGAGGPTFMGLRYSLDGFGASDIFVGAYAPDASETARAFDLSSISALQNTSATVSLRLYGAIAPSSLGSWRVSDTTGSSPMSLSGTSITIPEPGSLALLDLALLPGVFLLNRRR